VRHANPDLAVVEAARRYLGTPFHHQGRLGGVGLDCIGLLVAVAQDVGVPLADRIDYSRYPDGQTLIAECEKNLNREEEILPGRIGIFYFKENYYPQHVGIFTPYGMIHTYTRVRKVVEHVFDSYWEQRLHSVYSFKWQHSR